MGEPIKCFAESTLAHIRNKLYNDGIEATIQHLNSLQRPELEQTITELESLKLSFDSARIPEDL